MNFSRPIYWHEGMFILPQHFQQQDRYHEYQTSQSLRQCLPVSWGIKTLKLAESGLENDIFEIQSCEAVFKDGSLLSFPGNSQIAARNFSKQLGQTDKKLPVFLGIKRIKAGQNSVVSPQGRYILKENQTEDIFAEDNASLLTFLEFEAQIFFGEEKENAADYDLLQIAELEATSKGARKSKTYIPPCLNIHAHPLLFNTIKKITDGISSKAKDLQDYRRGRGLHSKEAGLQDIGPMLQSMSINPYLPPLQQTLQPQLSTHPATCFSLLRQIIASLSSFSGEIDFMGNNEVQELIFPDYDHNLLGEIFSQAARTIGVMLNSLGQQSGQNFVLTWDGEFYSVDVPTSLLDRKNKFYLAVVLIDAEQDIAAMLKDTAKICSRQSLPTLISRALYGIPAKLQPTAPPELTQKPGMMFFNLDTSSNLWERLLKDGNIAISFEKKQISDIKLELHIIEAQ